MSPLRRRTIFTLAVSSLLFGLRSTLTSMNFSGRAPLRVLRPLRRRLRRRPRIALLLVDLPPYNTHHEGGAHPRRTKLLVPIMHWRRFLPTQAIVPNGA